MVEAEIGSKEGKEGRKAQALLVVEELLTFKNHLELIDHSIKLT